MNIRSAAAVTAAFFVCSLFSSLLAVAHAQARADDLLAEVARSVTAYSRYTVFDDVRVEVEDGRVTLSGKVTQPAKKEEIGKRVEAIDGVVALRNDIEVLPAVPGDDDLRRRVARAIYGHAAFWHYAAMATPPIRIIVERNRVTLTGAVGSESDRLLARSLASGLGETSLTCQLTTSR